MGRILACNKNKKDYCNYKTDKEKSLLSDAQMSIEMMVTKKDLLEHAKHSREIFVSYKATFYNFVGLRQKSVFWAILATEFN